MNAFNVFARATRAPSAAALAASGALIAVLWASHIPKQWIYASVTSAAPISLVCGISGTILAAVLSLPRLEACEVTASRKLWSYRAAIVLTTYIACILIAISAALALASWWHFLPLSQSGVVLSALTFMASTVVDARYVTAIATTYALSCYFAGRGEVWWDILLVHPSSGSLAVVTVLACVAVVVFAVKGARPLSPEDEL